MLKIKSAEDFGLGFNCMTRLYMNGYNEEILSDMIKVCQEYLKWFSHRTIICSLRDLIKEYPFGWNEKPVPKQQAERYETLIKDLIRQAIGKEKQAARYRELEAELLTRQMFYKAQEKGGCKQELKRLLNELLDLDSLYTQKDCIHMYHQLMGIERYLVSVPEDVKAKSLLKQVELAKKLIGEKRVEFFEKEEGHLYEKIGEGIYQRKRIASVNSVNTIT